MKKSSTLRPIFFLWLCWALLMVGYQVYIQARFELQPPDYALSWTPSETLPNSQNDKPYLLESLLNDHVSWDSEYYLSIAVAGYDDPQMRSIPEDFTWRNPRIELKGRRPDWISMNYAFFPFYPLATRVTAFPLRLFGLNEIATATLAGVLVSMLGTLGAMLALYDLGHDSMEKAQRMRAAFYLIIWPAGMFLAQIYTEGLFLGLSFGALALARRQKWFWAGLLAAGATWTRAGGALLLLPLGLFWMQGGGLQRLGLYPFSLEKIRRKFPLGEAGKLVLIASPLWAYLLWNAALGEPFHIIESRFFSRGLLLLEQSRDAWEFAWNMFTSGNPQTQAYYLVEFAAIGFAFVACGLMLWRGNRILAVYSLFVIVFSLTSGAAQGMHRYVMAAPVIFLLPAGWSRNETFDRAWTLGNVLLMGVFAILFSFDFWAG